MRQSHNSEDETELVWDPEWYHEVIIIYRIKSQIWQINQSVNESYLRVTQNNEYNTTNRIQNDVSG